jgi:hypothetical protein
VSDPRVINPVRDEARSPGHEAALSARNDVEAALFALSEIPLAFDRVGIRDRLLHAIECAYAVLDSSVIAAVHLDGLGEGSAIITESAELLARAGDPALVAPLARVLERLATAAAKLRGAAEAVAQIQVARRSELVGGAHHDGPPAALPFRASCGLPELHFLQRRPLRAHVLVDAVAQLTEPSAPPIVIAPPTTLDELRALEADVNSGALERRLAGEAQEPPPAPVEPLPFPYEPAVEETEILRRLARDCLEDIANQRSLRKPNALESWLDQAPFEQRLLDNIDALAALGGGVLPQISLFHAEARAPDPERAFAVALSLGCVAGSDAVGAAVTTLKQSAPEELPGWFEGFWLAPSPAIDDAMADLTMSDRPEHIALGLDVLNARGRTSDEVVRRLYIHEDARVAQRVARALAASLPPDEAIAHLEHLCATRSEDDVVLAAIEALLRRQHGPTVGLLRAMVDSPSSPERAARALVLLGLVGRASDGDRLLSAANIGPSARLLRSIGRWGHVDSLVPLINFLTQSDEEIVAAAAEALERITGAGLRETVEERWEVELPPEAANAGGIDVPVRKVERVATDPERWSAWMRDRARPFDPSSKTRAGVAFTPLQIVAELDAKSTTLERREEAALELAVLTGVSSSFSPHDWVARQKQQLADLRHAVARLSTMPGAWSFARSRPTTDVATTTGRKDGATPRPHSTTALGRPDTAPTPAILPLAPMEPGETTAAPQTSPFAALGDGRVKGLPFAPVAPGSSSMESTIRPHSPPARSQGSSLDQTTIAPESPLARGTGTGPIAPIRSAAPPLPFTTPRSEPSASSHAAASPPPVGAARPPQEVSLGEITAAPMISPFARVSDLLLKDLPFAGSTSVAPERVDASSRASERAASTPPIGSVTGNLPTDLIARIARGALPFPSAKSGAPQREPPIGSTTGELPSDLIARLAKGLPFQSTPGSPAGPSVPSSRVVSASEGSPVAAPATWPQAPDAPFRQTTPDTVPSGKPPSPSLTLKQYASLCAELAVSPQNADAIFRRHGFESAASRSEADLAWRAQLMRNPVEYREWQGLYQHYQVYWAEQARRNPGR